MDDYITVLLKHLTEHSPSANWEYLARQTQQNQAGGSAAEHPVSGAAQAVPPL